MNRKLLAPLLAIAAIPALAALVSPAIGHETGTQKSEDRRARAPAFMGLINDAKSRIKEIHASEMPQLLAQNPKAKLIDTREESEYAAGHIQGTEWIGKGVIERDIEAKHPDKSEPLYLYCGSGLRSALAADNLQKMGYTNVWSIDGGWRVLKDLLPTRQVQ